MCPLCKITEICPLSQSPGAQDIQNTTLLKRSSEEAGLAARDGIAGCKGYRELLTQYFQLNPSTQHGYMCPRFHPDVFVEDARAG